MGKMFRVGRRRLWKKRTKDKKQDRAIRSLRQLVTPEWKNVTALYGANNIPVQASNAVVLSHISTTAQGTAGNQRIGNSIKVHKIVLRGTCENTAELTNQTQFVRICVLQDLRFNGTDPLGAELLTSYNVTDVSIANLLSDFNRNYVYAKSMNRGGKIKILMDKRILLQSQSGTTHVSVPDTAYAYGLTHPPRKFEWVKTFKKPLTVAYEGANEKEGTIMVATFPGSDTTAGDNPYITWLATLYYTDG